MLHEDSCATIHFFYGMISFSRSSSNVRKVHALELSSHHFLLKPCCLGHNTLTIKRRKIKIISECPSIIEQHHQLFFFSAPDLPLTHALSTLINMGFVDFLTDAGLTGKLFYTLGAVNCPAANYKTHKLM